VQLSEFLRIKQKDAPRPLRGKRLTNWFLYVNGKLISLAVHWHIKTKCCKYTCVIYGLVTECTTNIFFEWLKANLIIEN